MLRMVARRAPTVQRPVHDFLTLDERPIILQPLALFVLVDLTQPILGAHEVFLDFPRAGGIFNLPGKPNQLALPFDIFRIDVMPSHVLSSKKDLRERNSTDNAYNSPYGFIRLLGYGSNPFKHSPA